MTAIDQLKQQFSGDIHTDTLHTIIYATDASAYRMLPMAVAIPKTNADIKLLIQFAKKNNTTLIPRAAGTSLAGQCVGEGIVVDISKHFTQILSFDEQAKTVTVQPGVIRDELNIFLKPYGLFFGPNTSTSNRCMIGGMVGNNSSGTTSIQYGVTRDKVIALKTILSDGSEALFKDISKNEFLKKIEGTNLESQLYKNVYDLLSPTEVQKEIRDEFPHKNIHRRNNGYAIDGIIETELFANSTALFNLGKLLCGSEGTLAFTTEITLSLDTLPPSENILVVAHFNSVNESLEAVVVAMKHNLYMCEMMDKTILDCTKNNREQVKNRFFIQEDPEAVLMLEICCKTKEEAAKKATLLIEDLQKLHLGYAFPKLLGTDIHKVIELRKAGLGLLGNIVGDNKAVPCIEDTAVALEDLPNYIVDFTKMMDDFGQKAVYYAHAGAGELHLRPILNLKKKEDVALFRNITHKTALLVKKYNGSFSGEHGDGIVRAEFIPLMIGEKNYEILRKIKTLFDPHNVFNKGKIVAAYPMDKNLRYAENVITPTIDTIQDFTDSLGILRMAEKCNGSGDCRKLPSAGGTMCPSYRATRNEKDTTRARANTLREVLTNSNKKNRFDNKELKEVFDLCLSCKACASECPSNVDVAALKAEFLYQYYKIHGVPFRTNMIAHNVFWNRIGSLVPNFTNFILNTSVSKKIMGIALQRSIPALQKQTLKQWVSKHNKKTASNSSKNVLLFCDEFTNYYDTPIGIDTIQLLEGLGYNISYQNHVESGRSFISKGLLGKAKKIADKNIAILKTHVSENTPLIGIEPSAILTFRDEYLRLADDKEAAKSIATHTYTIEEFIQREIEKGNIKSEQFTDDFKEIKIHGHCQQKSLSSVSPTFNMLNLPKNYTVAILNTGCCGMAGSFGYEKEHYKISMQIGEDTLFPKIRKMENSTVVAAAGTSCRHQIYDGTNKQAQHPVSILKNALL
ncbi:MAG: FAD-binding oxidoreductase [Flavobacteriaceae bacterium]|nr:MAG: FAD-binding oxidoreductase [Flavobacteriaceae bacterium]